MRALFLVLMSGLIILGPNTVRANTCTYTYGVWNTKLKQVVRTVRVSKLKSELTSDEIGPFGCTPCREDQVQLQLSTGLVFWMCERLAGPVLDVLEATLNDGYMLQEIVAYRPSMSRGPVNSEGERTVLSNHAFGAALDINPNHNGLYDNCLAWGPYCRLIKGGAWNKNHPLSLKESSSLVKRLAKLGLKWGGMIDGNQKDMMHFSLTGY